MADGFSDLEQGFFAAAPPEVPEPPPEPARFDDLVPLPPRRTTARARLRRLRFASATRRAVSLSMRTWRTVPPALRAAREVTLRKVRAGTAHLVTLFPAERPARRAAVAAVATLIFIMGLSAGVVASRDSAPIAAPAAPARTPVVAKRDVLAVAVQPPPAPAPPPATSPMAPPSSESIARTAPAEHRAVPKRPHHRRAVAKKPVLAKATKSAARPTAGVAVPAPRPTAGVAVPAPRPMFSR